MITDADAPGAAGGDALAGRQLQVLGELAEFGLDIARAIQAEAQRPGADLNAVAMAYARVARAVRLTILLQSRLADGRRTQARLDGVRALSHRAARDEARKERIERIVFRVARQGCDGDEDEAESLMQEACERLDDDDVYGALSRPISEVLALICGDLGLQPDWAELAMEAWAREEIESGAPGAPLAALVECASSPVRGGGAISVAANDLAAMRTPAGGGLGRGGGGDGSAAPRRDSA